MKRIVLLIVFLVLSAGCLGGTQTAVTHTQNHTITLTETTTRTVTETYTQTVTVENKTTIEELNKTLSEYSERLSDLNLTLSEREAELADIKAKYASCLLQLALDNESRNGAEFKLLTDREYYSEVLRAIEEASDSIYVMMFSMKYDPDDSFDWANDLIRALVAAKNRGVDVHVLLEDGIESNEEAYSYLRSHGVDVSFDSPETTLHAKVIVIDGRLIFLGSHNWSESALYWNHEVSLMIASEELAERLIGYFKSIR
ncbi:phospholipase [Thermococcus sp. 5-4]|nr:phospholipase [Thermococcus sp. 5-4]